MRTRPTLPVLRLALLILLAPGLAAGGPVPDPALEPASAEAAPEPIVLREALLLPPVGRGGRAPIHTNAVEAAIVAGTFSPPAAGDEVTRPDGTTAAWRSASAGESGWLNDRALRGGYVYWSVEAPKRRIMMLEASGHSGVYVNGALRAGDPYANGWVGLPVLLEAGRNDLLFFCSRGRLRAKLVEPDAAWFIQVREPTLPDLILGEAWPVQAGVIVVNATETVRDDLIIVAAGAGLPVRETRLPPIAPLTVRKVPVWLGGPLPPETTRARVRLDLARDDSGVRRVSHTAEVNVRVLEAGQRHRRTFISAIDGSVQYYGVTPRATDAADGADPDAPPALILTLHGAGVEGMGQAAVYRPKDWAHVVAPTNRRPFGFDWEDWGRLDAIEVLDLNQRRLGIDPERVFLTGHSMGGHGTWHVGVTFPGRFAAIGPSAGWVSFWSYAGAARYEEGSAVERMLMRATTPSDTAGLARNTLHHGVYILHGEKDDNVPAEQGRFMRDHLSPFHPDLVYHEQPGAGHWWGNQCCDWPAMMEFFQARTRPGADALDAIEFHTASPGVSARSRWVEIEQQVDPLEFSSVRIAVDRDAATFRAETENVARLAIDVDHLAGAAPVTVEIDGQALTEVDRPEPGASLWFAQERGEGGTAWRHVAELLDPAEKGPHRYGPFKDAFRHRMVFVYGTQGTSEENAWAFAKARYDAETFWYRGNGAVDLVADTAFRPGGEVDRNVIVYGSADTNAAWAPLLGDGPVRVERGSVTIGDRTIGGDDLACLFIRPRPGSDVASVGAVSGSGPAGMRLTDRLPYFVSGVAYPDCIVLGPEVLTRGPLGVRAAGFFGLDWSVERGSFAWGEDHP